MATRGTRWEPEAIKTDDLSASGIHRAIKGKRLELDDLIARGGMGVVFSGDDRVLERSVAIKYLSEEDAVFSGEMLRRFVREARITAQLEHPNIVPLYDIGVDENERAYYVMRRVYGRSLRELLRDMRTKTDEEGWTTVRLLQAFIQICNAVDYAHERGFLHRDLKPDNVMMGEHGEVYVMDWGLAVRAAGQEIDLSDAPKEGSLAGLDGTLYGRVWGSIPYMAPEQARGDELDGRADVFSLGVMLFMIITGRQPVKADDIDAYIDFLEQRDYLTTSGIGRVQVPHDLEAIVQRATAMDVESRYSCVAELRLDVQRYLDGHPVAARPANALTHLMAFVRRHRQTVVVAAAIMLVAGLALAGAAWQNWRSERSVEAERAAREKVERLHQWQWNQILDDDFGAGRIASHWIPEGDYEVIDGAAHVSGGRPQRLVYAEPMGGDLRLRFRAKITSEYLNDVSCEFGPVRLQYGGYDNSKICVLVGSRIHWSVDAAPLVKDRWYTVEAERIGTRYRMIIDGALVIDQMVELGEGTDLSGEVALFGWLAHTVYDDVAIWQLGQPDSWDALELATRLAIDGEASGAAAVARLAAQGSNDPEVIKRAERLVRQQAQRATLLGASIRLRERIATRWPESTPVVSVYENGLQVEALVSGIDDLRPFVDFPIVRLNLCDNPITDIAPLAEIPGLEEVIIAGCPISSLAPLSGSQVRKLELMRTRISSLEGLVFPELTDLYLNDSPVASLAGVDMPKLRFLKIARTQIGDLEPLRNAQHLERIDMQFTAVRSLEPLTGVALVGLMAEDAPISNLEPLRGAPIIHCYVQGTRVRDLSPVLNPQLVALHCSEVDATSLVDLANCERLHRLKMANYPGVTQLANLGMMELDWRGPWPEHFAPRWSLRGFTANHLSTLALLQHSHVERLRWVGPFTEEVAQAVAGRADQITLNLAEAECLPRQIKVINVMPATQVLAYGDTLLRGLRGEGSLRPLAESGFLGSMLLVPQGMTWDGAQALAQAQGARLAHVTTPTKLRELRQWVGARQAGSNVNGGVIARIDLPGLLPAYGFSSQGVRLVSTTRDNLLRLPVLIWDD
ncbi:MAG: protein kinase [Planctomycetota bacterium]|nr:protein kinase [Planctomycetota bacterium]